MQNKMPHNNKFIFFKFKPTLAAFIAIMFCSFSSSSRADLTALTLNEEQVAACKDYFTSEWANPLDMNGSDDILYNLVPREVQQLSSFNYSNGVFSTSATGNDPWFRFLTWVDHFQGNPVAIADDTTRFGARKPLEFNRQGYRNLSLRMYSSVASDIQVLWDKHEGSFGITDPVATLPGWHTYTIDLATAGINDGSGDKPWTSGRVEGIRIDPARNAPGAEIRLDWAQLTPAASSCANLVANYTSSSGDWVTLLVDDNTDPLDGFLSKSDPLPNGSGSHSFSTVSLFPGNYRLYGIASKDHATLRLNPWDMDDAATDVDSARIFNINKNGTGFGSGKFCGTPTSNDANFYLKLPLDKPIDASIFNKFAIKLETAAGTDSLALFFFDVNQNVVGIGEVATNGSGIYQIDLSGVAGWSGQIGGLRISPLVTRDALGTPFCVDWVTLGSSYALSEPSLSAVYVSPQNPVVAARPVVKFTQPDREGGEDFFVAVRGGPSEMSNVSNIQHVDNVTEAWIYPGSAYTDSSGALKVGDYFQATSRTGSDDPTSFSVFLDYARPIDPDKYKIACFTLDVLAPVDIYHSVARVLWQQDTQNIDGDDLVLKTSGEARYCLRMDTMQLDSTLPAGAPNPWRKNTDGTGINYWRIDAHEESVATTFRFQDIRLAADHQADEKFLIVVDGPKDLPVNVYYSGRSDGTQGSLIGTLNAGRNTNTLLWNTRGVTDGAWFLYLTVGSETFLAPGAVRVSHSGNPDSAAPILSVDAPKAGHRFTDSLELAGHVLDNVRLATVEAFIDGQHVHNFIPNGFNKAVRDAYPSYPFNSHAGFQVWVDLSGYPVGNYVLTLKAYDTLGNVTEYQTNIEKVASNPTSPVVYPIPNEARVAVPMSAPPQQPTAVPTAPPSTGALSLAAKVSKDSMTVTIGNASGCSKVDILGNIAPNKTKDLIEKKKPITLISGAPNAAGQLVASATKLKSLKPQKKGVDTKMYLVARCDGTRHSTILNIDAKKIKKAKNGASGNVKAVLNNIKAKLKKS